MFCNYIMNNTSDINHRFTGKFAKIDNNHFPFHRYADKTHKKSITSSYSLGCKF